VCPRVEREQEFGYMRNKLRKIGVAVTASSFVVAGAWGISAADAGATSKAPDLTPSAKVIKCYRTYKEPKKIRCYEVRKRHERHNGRDVIVIVLVQVPTPKNPPAVIVVPSLPQPTTTTSGPTPPVSSPAAPTTGTPSPTSGTGSPTGTPSPTSGTGSPTATETGGTPTGSPTATETGGTDTGTPNATETGGTDTGTPNATENGGTETGGSDNGATDNGGTDNGAPNDETGGS
jgi:hypothetical protein